MTAGGVIGTLAAFLQTIEKVDLLENSDKALACDLNSVFSCTNVLNAWQSSVFGFPNSLMCMGFFVIFATVGVAGLAGATLTRKFRLGVQLLALFVLAFALWFMQQSIFSIGALCILCMFCIGGLLLVNWSLLRINAAELPLKAQGKKFVERMIKLGADTFIWVLIALVLAFIMVIKFA